MSSPSILHFFRYSSPSILHPSRVWLPRQPGRQYLPDRVSHTGEVPGTDTLQCCGKCQYIRTACLLPPSGCMPPPHLQDPSPQAGSAASSTLLCNYSYSYLYYFTYSYSYSYSYSFSCSYFYHRWAPASYSLSY